MAILNADDGGKKPDQRPKTADSGMSPLQSGPPDGSAGHSVGSDRRTCPSAPKSRRRRVIEKILDRTINFNASWEMLVMGVFVAIVALVVGLIVGREMGSVRVISQGPSSVPETPIGPVVEELRQAIRAGRMVIVPEEGVPMSLPAGEWSAPRIAEYRPLVGGQSPFTKKGLTDIYAQLQDEPDLVIKRIGSSRVLGRESAFAPKTTITVQPQTEKRPESQAATATKPAVTPRPTEAVLPKIQPVVAETPSITPDPNPQPVVANTEPAEPEFSTMPVDPLLPPINPLGDWYFDADSSTTKGRRGSYKGIVHWDYVGRSEQVIEGKPEEIIHYSGTMTYKGLRMATLGEVTGSFLVSKKQLFVIPGEFKTVGKFVTFEKAEMMFLQVDANEMVAKVFPQKLIPADQHKGDRTFFFQRNWRLYKLSPTDTDSLE